ncbi:MAG TPA: ammonium transporter [Rhizomicrobium sp.]|jgi:Amt family ammonium transporter|nr:ammonium transporter [Rhizomicrobium sp.]
MDSGDTAWILISSVLVLMMTLPALGFFYAGLVQAKNVLSVLIQCVAIACLVSVLWFACGYSLGRATIHAGTHLPESVFVMFQMTFAIITPALIIGAYVERIRYSAVLLISGLWLLVVYVPVTHWIWGGGWLAAKGTMDYAGGLVVHLTAGISALVIAWRLGPREGFPRINPPHAPWMVMVGAAMLWVGWFGFNAGSALRAGGDAGMTMLTTHLSAATATLVWMAIEWIGFGKPSLVGAVTGTVAGLATVTPASGFVGPVGGVVLGIAGSVVCYGAVHVVKRGLRTDDALDVLGVHGVGGTLGILLLPFLVSLGIGGVPLARPIWDQFLVQLESVGVVGLWSVVATLMIVLLTARLVGLRVSKEDEIQGLDFSSHGETGYNVNI